MDASLSDYVPDKLYERLFKPWDLHPSEWPLCKEDWERVDAVTRLPWRGNLLDFGAGDGTLAAMVCSRNPNVQEVTCLEQDTFQHSKAYRLWAEWPLRFFAHGCRWEQYFDGALLCQTLEHLTPEDGMGVLNDIKKALKPGGLFCVTVPHSAGPRASYPGHIREFNAATLRADLEEAGFTVDDGDTIGGKIIPVWILAVCHA